MNTTHKHTGLMEDPRSPEEKARDYRTGAVTAIPVVNRVPASDWRGFMPAPEAQSTPAFDVLSCTTFSAGHIIEAFVIWLLINGKFPDWQVARFQELGFFKDNADVKTFRISKRFSAITNGTTKLGNYFQKVADSFRNIGMIPDSMLSFGGSSFDEYMNPSLITKGMLEIAKEMTMHLNVQYEFLSINPADGISTAENSAFLEYLKQAPLQIAIPQAASHAIVMTTIHSQSYDVMDTYAPFFYTDAIGAPVIAYSLKYDVQATVPVLKVGSTGSLVKVLQTAVGTSSDGIFGNGTKAAVIAWQKAHGLAADGIAGSNTLALIYSLKKKA